MAKIPTIGYLKNLASLPKIVKNPALQFKKFLDNNDGLVKIHLPYPAIVTDHPELIRHVLQKNHKNYIKTKVVRTIVKDHVGNGLLTSDGEYWLTQRRAIQPGFHRGRLEKVSHIMVEEINHFMDNVLDVYADKGQEIDIVKEMTHLTFKIISRSLFGRSTDDNTLTEIDGIVTKMQEAVVELVRKPFIKPWLRLTGKLKRTAALKAKGEQLILDVIAERRTTKEEHDDLLEMLMETRYEDGGGMSDRQLLDEANILMVAGHETSAMAMSWAWYLIATHPEVEEQLLNASIQGLGDKDPSFEALRGMGYSLQVIEEVMRLYPPAWITDREPLEDEEFEGLPIKKGLDIICLIYSLHRNPKYWSEPEKFDPERFNEENKKQQIPYAYIPFGGGPRLCIGNNFALMEMQFILSMLVRRYQFELVSTAPIELNPLVTLRPKDGIKMRIKKRV